VTVDRERLAQALGGEALGWLWSRVRARLESGEPLRGTVRHTRPSQAERDGLSRLLGRTMRGEGISVRLEDLEALLRRAGLAPDLRAAAEALGGPVRPLREERERAEQAWEELYASAEPRVAKYGAGGRAWWEELRQGGLLKRAGRGDFTEAARLLALALEVAARLPAGGMPLAELAAAVGRDSHALDEGRPLGTLCVRLAARLGGVEGWETAEKRRDAWASVGVLCDELSAPGLVLNLRAEPANMTGRLMAMHAEAGEPQRLSIRQLLRTPPRFAPEHTGPAVFICENPNVVAAAANQHGASAAPLLCTEGQPKTAINLLLNALRGAGVALRFHVDFDWDGLRIGNLLARRYGARPWRMTRTEYLSVQGAVDLRKEFVVAEWEPELSEAMRHTGRAVHEEQVLGALLTDLRRE
jgi:uncharacterized protein (TIGR02679 family)